MNKQTAWGRPIDGEIPRYTSTVVQDDPKKFIEVLDQVLDYPTVEAVRWSGGTPSFNDGDPCVFRVYLNGIKLREAQEDEFVESYYLEDKTLRKLVDKFESILTSGKHNIELNRLFGDPSEVTATKEGFKIDYYDPD